MLDKNHALTAVLFDFTGIMVILGIIFMLFRGMGRKSDQVPGLPKQDFVALGLIGGIVLLGFILEGMRIAMTGAPANARYAFIGYGISTLFSDPAGLTGIYGIFWYGHAIFSGAFIAYIPFSRLLHIILSPVVLAARAASGHE